MRYMGPTEASKYPRPAPWIFRGNNARNLLIVGCVVGLIWIWI